MNSALDLRTVPLSRQRALIFASFDALAPGETLELVDDHDPMPLYFRLDRLREGEFAWRYLQTGPECWQVRIARVARQAGSDRPDPPA
ncbi:MAG: DUF2249 domain-containing protein [Rubrivivax sp.]|nr:DUF2249 domain-containing protein [Rubrivivax sp.]